MAAGSLRKFVVNGASTGDVEEAATSIVPTRGKNRRVGIAVRLEHEDWIRATEFAMREQTSLQRLIVAGLNEMLRQRGLPPLSGR
jgi:hypothetical protein